MSQLAGCPLAFNNLVFQWFVAAGGVGGGIWITFPITVSIAHTCYVHAVGTWSTSGGAATYISATEVAGVTHTLSPNGTYLLHSNGNPYYWLVIGTI